TGASMGIGESISIALAEVGANLILISRSEEKPTALAKKLTSSHSNCKVVYKAADIADYKAVDDAVSAAVQELGDIDILVNNVQFSISDILTMNNTNINGTMFVTYAVLNRCMQSRKAGTILNVTSITGLEVPPFPGEAVYHANKAAQEAFTNSLRNELSGTNIRVLALRPGCVATNFHSPRGP
ncbi:hypothetical protein V1517DRAFT_264048, partial [Lipomyces orientalis]